MGASHWPLSLVGGFPCPASRVLFTTTVVCCRGRQADLHSPQYLLWKKWQVGKGSREGGKAAHLLLYSLVSAEPIGCQIANSSVSEHGRCTQVRWDGSCPGGQAEVRPRVLRLYLFVMGRERWVLCSLSPALSAALNSEWDWKG